MTPGTQGGVLGLEVLGLRFRACDVRRLGGVDSGLDGVRRRHCERSEAHGLAAPRIPGSNAGVIASAAFIVVVAPCAPLVDAPLWVIAAIVLAHDRALEVMGGDHRAAARSQQVMLVVMVGFTALGLWLLSSL